MAKTVKEVLDMGKNVKMVDLRFIDVPGTWQHFTIPAHRLDAEFFEEGIPFDGSSIRGFQEIHESDMLLLLDPETAFIDPVAEIPTLVSLTAGMRATLPRKRKLTLNRPASVINAFLVRKLNSLFSTMSDMPIVRTNPFIPLTALKAGGIAAMPPNLILEAKYSQSAVISQFHQRIRYRHCEAKS